MADKKREPEALTAMRNASKKAELVYQLARFQVRREEIKFELEIIEAQEEGVQASLDNFDVIRKQKEQK